MPDIIQLLPDSVANQIAAGEVVQRPASAIKELLENAIDADALEIQLIIKNAGKTLIQVIDNGKGMSDTDARLSLERHATSKITKVEDLFSLNTMGFRGEALPSIAAVSQMEIKSKLKGSELGTLLILDASEVKSQEVCSSPVGTKISIKNLFFNIPARRNFLKSNPVEIKHCIEEFLRVALIHPEVMMSMHNEGSEVYRLPKGNYRQRIVNIFGNKYNQRLVPVEEKTDIVNISGFVGKAEFARKTRGEQYFFVNNRFIKSPYFNHAVQKAYEELLPKDQFPSYFLKLEIDPSKIDINIHPTKTEVKFEEERAIYAIVRTAVRQALGKFNVTPTIDFEQENSFNVPDLKSGESIRIPTITVDPSYNPFEQKEREKQSDIHFPFERKKSSIEKNWEQLYHKDEPIQNQGFSSDEVAPLNVEENTKKVLQLHQKYILNHIKSGFIIVDQQAAHQRILYEELKNKMQSSVNNSQQLLFPENISLSAADMAILSGLLDEFTALGFDIRKFGKNDLIVNGLPTEAKNISAHLIIEQLLEEFKTDQSALKNNPREKMIQSIAKSMSIKAGKQMSVEEMSHLIDQLFACEMPYHNFDGKPIIVTYSLEDLDKQFKKK